MSKVMQEKRDKETSERMNIQKVSTVHWEQIKLAHRHRPICWQRSLWTQPRTDIDGTIVAP